jgi:hypothetical protein
VRVKTEGAHGPPHLLGHGEGWLGKQSDEFLAPVAREPSVPLPVGRCRPAGVKLRRGVLLRLDLLDGVEVLAAVRR